MPPAIRRRFETESRKRARGTRRSWSGEARPATLGPTWSNALRPTRSWPRPAPCSCCCGSCSWRGGCSGRFLTRSLPWKTTRVPSPRGKRNPRRPPHRTPRPVPPLSSSAGAFCRPGQTKSCGRTWPSPSSGASRSSSPATRRLRLCRPAFHLMTGAGRLPGSTTPTVRTSPTLRTGVFGSNPCPTGSGSWPGRSGSGSSRGSFSGCSDCTCGHRCFQRLPTRSCRSKAILTRSAPSAAPAPAQPPPSRACSPRG
mmetsp:Transcript_409/g.1558  ORF Transcript_409/g.1558 Transcript_409/m.1558 type:complete len:255 (+) Transcript_409:41-805(+)